MESKAIDEKNVVIDSASDGPSNEIADEVSAQGVTGYALTYSGPVGAILCFFIVGVDVYFVMKSLGEMSTLFPTPGAFVEVLHLDPTRWSSAYKNI
jgi:hypothetical protein